MIEITALTKTYGDFTAVDSVDLSIPDGQFTVLLGPSGSGKTTILRMLNRMVEPTSGTVLIDGADAAAVRPDDLRRGMGYVIQNTGLFPNMSVRRNVATVPRLLGWDRDRTRKRVDEMLDLVGLDPALYAAKLPSQLSGGEAQRVGVARALAADPPVLLMDEPFGAVDPITRGRLQLEMKRLQKQLRKTVVFVTHDIDEAVLLADRIALLKNGVLQQYASPGELWRAPANDFVRDFFGDGFGLRIMSRVCLSDAPLDPVPGDAASLPHVDADATVRDALAELVDHRAEHVVIERDGAAIGSLSFPALIATLGRED
ncbi:MAG: ABC transporter ATP-binding protein [Coriobacteriia bacterium]|nr:ABC transporter ATP-binding protein [Coriobacteriia bacterium]